MCEDAPCCGCCPSSLDDYEREEDIPFADEGGHGGGEDDFADYNANEADDYRDE